MGLLKSLGFNPRIKLVKIFGGTPFLEDVNIKNGQGANITSAQAGDEIWIWGTAVNANGLRVSPFGDPNFMEFFDIEPPGKCIGSDPKDVWAGYRIKQGVPEGNAKMVLAIRHNTEGCDGNGGTADSQERFIKIIGITPPPDEPPPLEEPPIEPPPEEPPTPPPDNGNGGEPIPLVCKIPIIKLLFDCNPPS